MKGIAGHFFNAVGKLYERKGAKAKAEAAYRRALHFRQQDAGILSNLALLLIRKRGFGEALSLLDEACRLRPQGATLHGERGRCLFELDDHTSAAEALAVAVDLAPAAADYHNLLAEAFYRLKKNREGAEALERACALEDKHAGWQFRRGRALDKLGRLGAAIEAYRKAISLRPDDAEWHYRLGLALERSGDAEAASAAYVCAVEHDRALKAGRFGIGAYHAREQLWHLAAPAFAATLACSDDDAELHYRLGFAHDRCYQWILAEQSYSRAIALQQDTASWHYRLGFVRERQCRWDDAAASYRTAIALDGGAKSYWLFRLAYVLEQAGRLEEAVKAYRASRSDVQKPEVPPASLPPDLSKHAGIDSLGPGTAEEFLGLARAALESGRPDLAVEACRAAADRSNPHVPAIYHTLGNALARSGRLAEACEAFRGMRIRWSAVGFDTKPYETSGTQKAVANYAEYRQCLPIREKVILYESDLGETVGGQPLAIFEHLLAQPAFQGALHVWITTKSTPRPAAYESRADVIFVVRGSDRYLRYLAEAKYLVSNAAFPAYFSRRPEQSYLLAWDGSAAAAREQGPAADPGFMSHRNIVRNILHATHVISPDAEASDLLMLGNGIASIFCGKLAETGDPEDRHSARRAADFFFRGDDRNEVTRYRSDKEKLLFFGGHFTPNGITSSCLNLLNSLPAERYDVSVAIDTNVVVSKPDNRARLSALSGGLHVLGRTGHPLFTHEQRWVYERFHATSALPSGEMRAMLMTAMRHEFERTFGATPWKAIVNFEGFTRFWAAMFAAAPESADKIIYLHADMAGERTTRFPSLTGVFELYRHYDKLVSPSVSVNAVNRANLSDAYGVLPEKFRHAGNVIMPAALRERAEEPLREDIAAWVGKRTLFATVGRLSPEKDHDKLLRAFSKIYHTYPQARLLVVGDGPLREALQRQIRALGLQESVLLAGLMHNPMPVFKRMDCFVFSSNYEGQGIVLLEALVLGKPVISTDVVGCRSVLENGEGMLVENSVAGLVEGMRTFLEGHYKARPFAADDYARTAIDEFNALIGQ